MGQINKSLSAFEEIHVKTCYSSGNRIVTRVWKKADLCIITPAQELIDSHVTRENRIYARQVLQHASLSEDPLVSRLAAALRYFVFLYYAILFVVSANLLSLVSVHLFIIITNTHECLRDK
jgi:hypothetical protein